MKTILFFLTVIVLAAAGCAPSYIIVAPPEPESQPSASKTEATPAPAVKVWRPDPTMGIICNRSPIHFVGVWIDKHPTASPSPLVYLIPETCSKILYLDLGKHVPYGEAEIETQKGRVSVGSSKLSGEFEVRSNYFPWGGLGWRVDIYEGHFNR